MTCDTEDFNLRIDLRGVPASEHEHEAPKIMLVTREDAIVLAHAHQVSWYCRAVGYALASGCVDAIVLPSSFMGSRESGRLKRRTAAADSWYKAYDAARARGAPAVLAAEEADRAQGTVNPAYLDATPPHASDPPIIEPGQSPGTWKRTREWIRRIVGTPARLGQPAPIPWVWFVVPSTWSPKEDADLEDLPPVLSAADIRDLPQGKAQSLRRRREGLQSVEVAYRTLRELGYVPQDIRGTLTPGALAQHVADAKAYGGSYALRAKPRNWLRGAYAGLALRGLGQHVEHVAAAVAVRVARRAKTDVGGFTPDMGVLATVGERAARGRGEEILDVVASVPVRMRSGRQRGQWLSLAEALHSGEWFHISDESFRQYLEDWMRRYGHVLAAEPWRCRVTFDDAGNWVRPSYNIRTIIQNMYGVGTPQSKKARDGDQSGMIWRFTPAQIRQRLRDSGRPVPLDFTPPEELAQAILRDDPWKEPTPGYIPILQAWRGNAQNLRADDPAYDARKRALDRLSADLPIEVDEEKMKEIIATLPKEQRPTPRAALRKGKALWSPNYRFAENGRITCSDPNIQGLTAACREAIRIPEGQEVVDVDLTSAHANIAALVAGDETLERELQSVDVYQALADTIGTKRGDAKIRFLSWLNGKNDDVLEAYVGAKYPDLHSYITSVDRSIPERRTLLASTWTEVEGKILTHVLANLPDEVRVIAPMHDGLVYRRAKTSPHLDDVVAELWRDGAQKATGSTSRWKVKITVNDTWR